MGNNYIITNRERQAVSESGPCDEYVFNILLFIYLFINLFNHTFAFSLYDVHSHDDV